MRILFLMLICMVATVAVANRQMLTEQEMAQKAKLDSLQWKPTLSVEDTTSLRVSLSSLKDEIAGSALVVALVHEGDDLKGLLRREVGPTNGWSRQLANAILMRLTEGESLRAGLFLVALANRDSTESRNTMTAGELATRAVVVRKARELREGKPSAPETNGLSMGPFEQKLLYYSQMPNEQAISTIIERVRQVQTAGDDEYVNADVLCAYGSEALEAVFKALAHTERTTKYGKVVLLRYLEQRSLLMSEEEKQRLRSLLDAIDRSDRSVASACENIERRLVLQKY